MTWKPLVKTELDLKGQSKSEIIERNLETIKRLNKENNGLRSNFKFQFFQAIL